MLKKMVLCLMALGLAGTVGAQNIWLVTKPDHLELNYGRDTPELYNPAKVTELKAWDAQGQPVVLQKGTATDLLTIVPNKQAALIAVTFDNGYWVQASSTEWKNVSLENSKTFRIAKHPMKYHKSLYAWSKAWAKPIGLKLEIVPLQDPFKTALGKPLPVQVLFDGKPLPHAKVEYGVHGDQAPSVETDKNGKAKVPITPVPEQFIAVEYDLPAPAKGPAESYATSLRYQAK